MSDSDDYYFADSDHSQEDEFPYDLDNDDDDEQQQHEQHKEITTAASVKTLDEQTLIQTMNELIQSVSSLLSLPPDSCSILLRNFHWDVLKLQDVWFSDQFQACQSAGLLLPPPVTTKPTTASKSIKTECQICFTNFRSNKLSSAACGHLFCNQCWKQYIYIAIKDGFGCLILRCPETACHVSLDEDLINRFATERLRARFKMLLVKNFVECSKGIKWCPARGCQFAIEFTSFRGQEDVNCKCGHKFCWDCGLEPHRPVDCETATKWEEKNNADSLNADWILVNSKPCPKCKRSIEKNQGCNHITCSLPCRYQFCWTCLGDRSKHNDAYACNKLVKQDDKSLDMELKRVMARRDLEKYTHYYQRWMNNYSSEKKAIESIECFKVQTMSVLSKLYCETDAVLERSFVCAWKQIAECRRVLRWTYAYGYYLPEDQDVKKTELFEDLQGQAEAALERLHHCVEKEIEKYLKVKDNKYSDGSDDGGVKKDLSKEFFVYMVKVTELTNTTRKFFDNLVEGMETGLI